MHHHTQIFLENYLESLTCPFNKYSFSASLQQNITFFSWWKNYFNNGKKNRYPSCKKMPSYIEWETSSLENNVTSDHEQSEKLSPNTVEMYSLHDSTLLRLAHLLLIFPFNWSYCYAVLAMWMNLSCFNFLSRNIKHWTFGSAHIWHDCVPVHGILQRFL